MDVISDVIDISAAATIESLSRTNCANPVRVSCDKRSVI